MLHQTARNEGFLEFPFWKQSFIYGACGQDGPLRLTIKPLLGACFSKCCNLCPYRWKPEQNAANKLSPFQRWRPKFSIWFLLANGSILIEGKPTPKKWGDLISTPEKQSNFQPQNHSLAKGCFKKAYMWPCYTKKNWKTELLYQGHSDCLYAPCAASGRVLWTGPPVPSLHVEEGGASVAQQNRRQDYFQLQQGGRIQNVSFQYSVSRGKSCVLGSAWSLSNESVVQGKVLPNEGNERKSPTDPVATPHLLSLSHVGCSMDNILPDLF